MYTAEPTQSSKRVPYLRRQGNATQLVVDGRESIPNRVLAFVFSLLPHKETLLTKER